LKQDLLPFYILWKYFGLVIFPRGIGELPFTPIVLRVKDYPIKGIGLAQNIFDLKKLS
jgi:hypothetical protein